jgi:deazaflavin-dependent oxidoreductase (nitroreductase family)
MVGLQILLLTTTGRKTGTKRTTPLGSFQDDGAFVVVGSNGGLDSHPGWFHNLLANPRVELQVRADRFPAVARVASASERPRLWARLVVLAPPYGEYEKRTKREIPLVVLRRLGS